MRLVLDTNILIAAALRGGFSEEILSMAAQGDFGVLVCSEEILNELIEKLVNKFQWLVYDAKSFANEIRKASEIVETKIKVDVVKNDPDDNKILECALAGKADLIVSADQDLIKLKKFRGIGIVHPKTLAWTFPKYFRKSKR